MTWSESVETYLKQHPASTAALYSRGLARFRKWYIDHYEEEPDPVLLTDEELRQWQRHLYEERKLAASTVNWHLTGVRGKALDRIEPRRPFREVLVRAAACLDREAGDEVAECAWSEIVEAQDASLLLLDYTDIGCGVREQHGNTVGAFCGEGYAYQPGLHGDGAVSCYHSG